MRSFAGLDADRGEGSTDAPQASVSAGPWHILHAVGSAMRYDNTQRGADENSQLRTSDTLFEDSDLRSEPAAVYFDRLSSRTFVAALARRGAASFLYLGINASNQVLGMPENDLSALGWCRSTYEIDDLVDGDVVISLGSNERWLGVSLNPLQTDAQPVVVVFDKKRIIDYAEFGKCPSVQPTQFLLQSGDLGIMPSQHASLSQETGAPLYLVSNVAGSAGSDTYSLWSIPGSGKRPRMSRTRITATTEYSAPPFAAQKGGQPLDAGDGRISQVAYRDGRIWVAHTTACASGRAACVRVLGIDPAQPRARGRSAAPSAETTLQGKRGWHYWMPGLAVNRHGDVAVTFAQSRTNKFVSAAVAMLPAGEGQFTRAKRLISGRCALADGGGPAYGQPAQPDPFDDNAFWFVGSYAHMQGGRCAWGSRIALAVADGTRPPAPVVVASGQVSLPSTTQFSGPGFHQPFEIAATLPANLDATTGKRLVLRLRDQGRPAIQCGSEHPLSGCGTIDYSCPDIALDDRLVLPIAGGTPRTYYLSDAQLLVDKKVVRPG